MVFDFAKKFGRKFYFPFIIMLTAKVEDSDKIMGAYDWCG